MRYIVLVFIVLFFSACGGVSPAKNIYPQQPISDLKTFNQSSFEYLKNLNIKNIETNAEVYENNYFRVWNKMPTDTKEESMWPFSSYRYGDMYGENLQLVEEEIFENIKNNSNFKNYKKLNKSAITLNHLDIRGLPTSKPMFKNPNLAGEGFPFDYIQNSTVSANKPILISHYSKDKKWAFIFTSFTSGWVKSKDIVEINKKYTNMWQKAKQIFLVKDGIPLYDEKGNFLFKSRVGMMLALIGEDKNNYTVLSVSSYKNHQANYHRTKVSKKYASKGIMHFNKKNIQVVFDEVSKSKYGWGGMNGQRDCSSTIRDIYTPFGLWLPRNSYQQSNVGKVISLENLEDDKKIELIKKEAVPFKTLLYKKGHVLVYIGTIDDKVVVFHNVWGIKIKQDSNEGRIIVGKSIYSSLELGKEQKYYDANSSILKNLKSMNIINN